MAYRWRLVLTLGFTETISWGILYYAFSVLIGPMQAELGWSRAELTGAFSVAILVLGLVGVPVGHWLDERGPRLLMTAGSVLGVALVIGWSLVQDLATFYALWILMGVCWSATLYAPAFATVTAHFRERRTEALTAVTLMAGLASTIFFPLTAFLVEPLGWRSALMVLAAILAVTIPLHALVLRKAPEAPEHDREQSLSLGDALRHPSFRWLALGFVCFALSIGLFVHLVPYLSERGFDLTTAATISGLVGVTQVLGRIALAPLERRLDPTTLIGLVYGLLPVAIVILLLGPAAIAPWIFVVLFGASRGADTLIRNTVVARLYGPRRFASISAVLSLVITAAWAGGPIALGAVYDAFGSYEPGVWVIAAASVVAAVAVVNATRRPGDGPQTAG